MSDTTYFQGHLFDGKCARAIPVRVGFHGEELHLADEGGSYVRSASLRSMSVSEPFDAAPRMLGFDDGATLEMPASADLTAALGRAGQPPRLVARLQRAWPVAVTALLLLVAGVAAGYRFGLPAVARRVAFAMPESAQRRLGDGVLKLLDGGTFRRSAVPESRRAAIRKRFAAAAARAAPGVRYYVVFRNAEGALRTNALSLPGGIIVLLDGLTDPSVADDVTMAVLAHELGHVVGRHATRNVLQAAGLGAMAGLLWGDFSSQAANVPFALAVLRYSRAFEWEADEFAVQLLRANGQSPRALHDALGIIRKSEEQWGLARLPEFLSTHPAIQERMERLRRETDFGGLPGRPVDAPPTKLP